MSIGQRLRALRKQNRLTQKELAKRAGLLRCNVWRLENREAAPTIATLEKIARALEIPMFQIFYDYETSPWPKSLPKWRFTKDKLWGSSGKDASMLARFCQLFSRMSESDLEFILSTAKKVSRRKVV